MFTHWHLVSFGWSILYLGWCICICSQTSRPASCLLYSPILPCSCLVEPHLASKLCFPPDIWFLSHQYFYFRLWVPSFALLKVILGVIHTKWIQMFHMDAALVTNITLITRLPLSVRNIETQNLLCQKHPSPWISLPKIYLAQNFQAQNLLGPKLPSPKFTLLTRSAIRIWVLRCCAASRIWNVWFKLSET